MRWIVSANKVALMANWSELIKIKFPDVLILLAIMWSVHLVQWLVPGNLNQFGILPRSLTGLVQIPLSPFLHGSLLHIVANSIPLLGLGILAQLKGRLLFWEVVIIITVLAGIGTWAIGSSGYHIGASGLVLGLWSFILADAYFRKSMLAILVAFVTLIIYWSLAFSIFDFRPGISWAGHISGILAGIIVAWLNAHGEKSNVLSK